MIRPHSRITIHLSQSADQETIDALLSTLLVFILKMNSNDVSTLIPEFKQWIKKATPLLNQMGVKKEIVAASNKLQITGHFYSDAGLELGKALYAVRKVVENDPTIDLIYVKMFKDSVMCLQKNSEPAWHRLEKGVAVLRHPKLNLMFLAPELAEDEKVVETKGNVKDAVAKLKVLTRKINGKSDYFFFPLRELQALKNDPKKIPLLVEHAACTKIINAAIKDDLRRFVRNSGKDLVSIDVYKAHLAQIGLVSSLPIGFTGGQIDENQKFYTRDGLILDRDVSGVVRMNPKYIGPESTCFVLGNLELNNFSKARTKKGNLMNRDKRDGKVAEFFKNEKAHVKAWRADLGLTGNKSQIYAAIVEMCYTTACRIGDKNNKTAGEPTYGLTTLQVRHLKIEPGLIRFDYTGKKAHAQQHTFPTTTPIGKKVLPIVKALLVGKTADDLVFTIFDKPLTAKGTNEYMTAKGIGITAHFFRRITGTRMANAILESSRWVKGDAATTQKAVEDWILEEFKKIGEILHHTAGKDNETTGKTAITAYVDSSMMRDFFDKLGLRKPKFVPEENKG